MLWPSSRLPLIVAAATLCLAAAPAKKPPAKAPPQTAKSAPAGSSYDARNPQSLIDLLLAAGAKAEVARREEDTVLVAVRSPAADFSVQFAGCDRQGRNCQAALFDALGEGAPTYAQINAYNQASLNCRVYEDKAGKAHVLYSALLLKSDTRESGLTHLAAWQGCVAEGREFMRDPAGFLANAA